ncbi:hypothetical protein GCM10010505_36980 [Kitasatospora aburaviensis]
MRTVKLLADAASPEDLFQGQWQGRPSKLDAFKPYLDDRWNQGCTNAWRVWEEIVPLGYQGSYQRVRAHFREKRLSPGPVTARPPSPRVVAGWILRRPETLTETEHLRLKAVLVHCPECERQGVPVLADRAYIRAGPWVTTPIRRLPGQDLTTTQRAINRALSAARAPVERSIARLKSWQILRRARCSPNRMTFIAADILTLERQCC